MSADIWKCFGCLKPISVYVPFVPMQCDGFQVRAHVYCHSQAVKELVSI